MRQQSPWSLVQGNRYHSLPRIAPHRKAGTLRNVSLCPALMRKTGQPTITDVARIAGVSKKTVSRVINRSPLLYEETRRKVEVVIEGLSYIPYPQARARALRRIFLIGLVHDNPNA